MPSKIVLFCGTWFESDVLAGERPIWLIYRTNNLRRHTTRQVSGEVAARYCHQTTQWKHTDEKSGKAR